MCKEMMSQMLPKNLLQFGPYFYHIIILRQFCMHIYIWVVVTVEKANIAATSEIRSPFLVSKQFISCVKGENQRSVRSREARGTRLY